MICPDVSDSFAPNNQVPTSSLALSIRPEEGTGTWYVVPGTGTWYMRDADLIRVLPYTWRSDVVTLTGIARK